MKSSWLGAGRLKKVSLTAGKWLVLLFLFSPLLLVAQRQKITNNSLWLCHFGTFTLGDRYFIGTEVEVHSSRWAKRWAEQVYGLSVNRGLNKNWRVGGAVEWHRNAVYLDKFFFKNEWRTWQDVTHVSSGKKVNFLGRVRVEERWIQALKNGEKTGDYDFVSRLRLRTELQWPLPGGKLTPVLANEIMFVAGPASSNSFVDQNRTWLGLNLRVARSTTLQFQYMKIFLWRVNNVLENQNVIRLNIAQQFSLKK